MIVSFLYHWLDFPSGAVLTNLIASLIGVACGYVIALYHLKCVHCWRPGHVPVKGTVHKVCKKHAIEKGHTH